MQALLGLYTRAYAIRPARLLARAPILLGALLGFWGVVLAAPLLAVIYAYRSASTRTPSPRG